MTSRRIALLVLVAVGSSGLTWRGPARDLAEVSVSLTAVADSGEYFVYRYEIRNSSASTSGIGYIEVDISADSGAPATLPATGALFDLTVSPGGALAAQAEVGPITPTGWEAALDGRAHLSWYPPGSAQVTEDSIAPGEAKAGFGIRSSYLPGLTSARVEPTVESCCLVPDTIDGELIYPLPGSLGISIVTVVPRYRAGEVDVALLQEQLGAICQSQRWIEDASVCSELADSLDAVENRLLIPNVDAAKDALIGLSRVLELHTGSDEAIPPPAGLLLRTNVMQLLENIDVDNPWLPQLSSGLDDGTVSPGRVSPSNELPLSARPWWAALFACWQAGRETAS